MKKIFLGFFVFLLVSCGSTTTQDVEKLEEFKQQYTKHTRNIANYMYTKKLSLWSTKTPIERDDTILETSKMLLKNCKIIVDENLQNTCKTNTESQIAVVEKIFNDGDFELNKEAFSEYSKNNKDFSQKLQMYLDEQKLK